MRALLLRLSESKRLAPLMMRNGVSRRVARRFVAGEKLDDALEAAREVNRALQLASLDLLGENVSDEAGRVAPPTNTSPSSTASRRNIWMQMFR